MPRPIALFAVAAVLLSLTARNAEAQVLYSSLVVEARDSGGGAVPGASVSITQQETGWTRSGVTSGAGTVTFANVPPGTFTVHVTLQGFKESLTKDVSISDGSAVRVASTLEVGELSEEVTVAAGAAVLQTDRADVRTELNSSQLENLPVPIGRNYQSLFTLVPGITPPENMHSTAVNPARGLGFTVNGTTRNANTIRIEGAIANNIWLPHVAAYVPALEAIDTVSVTTSTFDADLGLSGGMSANVLIKSGTNQFHGSAFEYHYDQNLKAKPFFLPAGQPKPDALENQAGGTLGGPIQRNRLFFFGSYQGTFDRQTSQRFGTVPTAAMRAGDLSASPTPIYDPLTGNANGTGRTAFDGNIIKAGRLDPIVQKLLAQLPLPTFTDRLTDNYFASGRYTFTRHTIDGKVNWNATNKLRFAGRVGWLNHNFVNPPMFGDLGGLPVNTTAAKMGQGLGNTVTITGSGTYVVSPTFLIDAYAGITIEKILSEPPRMDENLGLDFLGIPGTNGPDRLYGGWPQFNVTNFSVIGYSGSSGTPYVDDNWQRQFTANATWTKAAHTIRFGGDIVRQAMNRFEVGDPSGTFTFDGGPTTLNGGPASNQYNTFADFLLGLPTAMAKSYIPFENNHVRSRNWQFSAFVKDQWQATRRLTASLGVRWDRFPMGTRTTRGMERYDFATNQMLICGVANIPTDCGYRIGPGYLSPRVGAAYRVTDAIVVRGGFGRNYDPYPLAFVRDTLLNYPSAINLSVTPPNSFGYAGMLAAGIPPIVVPDVSSGTIPVPLNVDARALDQRPRRGYVDSWNLTVESELPFHFTGQAGYVGTRQRKINQILDQNAGQVIGAGNAGRPLFVKFGRTQTTGLLTNVGWSDYDALQVSVRRRMAQGIQAAIAYTYSRSFGICCDTLSDGAPQVQAMQYFNLNEALLPNDRPHNLQVSVVAELPFGEGKPLLNGSGLAAAIAGGWQVNALVSAYSGSPFTVTASGTSLNLPGSNQVADQVKPDVAILGGIGPNQKWFDTSAFAPVTQPRFGTSGFDSMRGPGFRNLDLGVFRQLSLGAQRSLQIRVEIFNVTNTPHFANPNGNVNSSGFGTITSTANTGREGIDERLVRVGLRFGF
jgi:hypothetical protein